MDPSRAAAAVGTRSTLDFDLFHFAACDRAVVRMVAVVVMPLFPLNQTKRVFIAFVSGVEKSDATILNSLARFACLLHRRGVENFIYIYNPSFSAATFTLSCLTLGLLLLLCFTMFVFSFSFN